MVRKIILFCFLLLTVSCFPVKYISIEVLKPAKTELPSEIRSISLVSAKNEINQPKGQLEHINNLHIDREFNYYSLAWDYLYATEEILLNSPRFDRVVISSVYIFNFFSGNDLNWNEIIKINRIDSTDAILLIEDFNIKDSLKYLELLNGTCYVDFKLDNTVKWKILYPKQLQVIASDSNMVPLTWEREGFSCNNAMSNFPEGWDMLRESSYTTGKSIGLAIAPVWRPNESRNYFLYGNKNLRTGSLYASSEDWGKALEYWKMAYQTNNKKIAAKAAYNLSLAYEIHDDIHKAYRMIEISDSLFSTSYSRIYRKKLNSRIKERELLDDQMGLSD